MQGSNKESTMIVSNANELKYLEEQKVMRYSETRVTSYELKA